MQYRRVLIKISGQLLGSESQPIDLLWINRVVQEIQMAMEQGVQVAIVVGGGNLFRGASLSQQGVSRISADSVGMLATVMNSIVLADIFEQNGSAVEVMSAVPIMGHAEHFNLKKAVSVLESGSIVVFAGGTGNPLVTTDSAASLRAIEIGADILLKATRVDGVYDSDPEKHKNAKRYEHISYADVMHQELKVMDMGAFVQCHQHALPICVFDVKKPKALLNVLSGKREGTLISGENK